MGRAQPVRVAARYASAGFTLMEALLASTILAAAVVALAQAVAAGQAQTAESLHAVRAMLLADAMLEEVLAEPYNDPVGTDTETGRSADDLDDFHNFFQALNSVTDAGNVQYPRPYQRFSRRVTVVAGSGVGPVGASISGKQVTVTVTDDRGSVWVLRRFVPAP